MIDSLIIILEVIQYKTQNIRLLDKLFCLVLAPLDFVSDHINGNK